MFRLSLVCLLLIVFSTVALAQNPSGLVLEARAEVEIEVVTDQGETLLTRQEAALVTPGDEVIYTIQYTNAGEDPAEAVVITNPVPAQMFCRSLDDTPKSILVTLSVDGGDTFDSLENLLVINEEGEIRPARIADCTHVRWTLDEPLPPGASGQVSFRAVLQ